MPFSFGGCRCGKPRRAAADNHKIIGIHMSDLPSDSVFVVAKDDVRRAGPHLVISCHGEMATSLARISMVRGEQKPA